MKTILDEISRKEEWFARQPFFELLEGEGSYGEAQLISRSMSFFIMTFQDVLRMTAERMRDPALRAMAEQHRREDAGHERWFLRDVRMLEVEPDVEWLFGDEHQITRDASFQVISEVLRSEDDSTLLAVTMAMEAAGEVFLSRSEFFDRISTKRPLLFFSKRHWDAEQNHEVDQEPQQRTLTDIALTPAQRDAALAAVERTFAAMAAMCADIHRRLIAHREGDAGAASSRAPLSAGTHT